MSKATSYFDTLVSIFSGEPVGGSTPSTSPCGQPPDPSGPEVAPARRSARPEKRNDARRVEAVLCRALDGLDTSSASSANTPGTPTAGTSGPRCGDSSATADLQSSLASRLLARTEFFGSPEFEVHWKELAIPLGPPACRLVASVRRTGDTACSGWPTPTALSFDRSHQTGNNRNQNRTVKLSSWATPAGNEFEPTDVERMLERRESVKAQWINGNGFGLTLGMQAHLVEEAPQASPWVTPAARDHKMTSHRDRKKGEMLDGQAQLASWGTPKANEKVRSDEFLDGREPNAEEALAFGETSISSRAATAKCGVLNPEFSRWLMGFPETWGHSLPGWESWALTQRLLGES